MGNESTYDETKEIRCGLNGKQDSVNNSEKVQLTKRYNDLTLISMHKKLMKIIKCQRNSRLTDNDNYVEHFNKTKAIILSAVTA